MTGPSSIQGAQVIRLKKANCTVTAHSQVRDLKSAQPSAISARRVERAAGSVPDAPAGSRPPGSRPPGSRPPGSRPPASRPGRRSRLSASTLTAYDAASAAITTAGPATATRAPPSAGPAIVVAEPASPYSAFALPS